MINIYITLIIQNLLLGILLFGDIGFDHPGKYGLSWHHFIFLSILYVVALGLGTFLTILKKSWKVLGIQLIIPLVAVLYLFSPSRKFDASQYQELVGKTEAEVEKMIGQPKGMVRSKGNDIEGGVIHAEISLKGMDIIFSPNGTVSKVVPNEREQ